MNNWLTLSLEVDRAFENLQKSGKGYAMGARRKPTPKASLRSGAPIFTGEAARKGFSASKCLR